MRPDLFLPDIYRILVNLRVRYRPDLIRMCARFIRQESANAVRRA